MKKIFFLLLSVVILSACQEEDTSLQGNMGYLRLDVTAVSSTNTKSAVPENYNPKQLHVEIKDASGNIVKRTDNFDLEWKGKEMMLSPGNYTIAASSNGFDGNASGEGIPYYMGSTTVTIPADGSSVSASIVCRLANVKVTFRFDTSVLSVFKSLAMEVVSSVSGVLPQSATCSPTERVVYFPVGDLTVRTAVTNMAGTTFPALEKPITGVKARDHYILNCKLGDSSNGGITVEADDSEKEYTYTFEVPTVASTQLGAETPAVLWSRFAHLEGSILSKSESFVLDPSAMRFEWKKKDDANWNTLASTQEGENYKAILTGLQPETAYMYRLVYSKGSDQYASDEVMFTTDTEVALYNGSFEFWSQSGKTWYPGSSAEAGNTTSFWNTSNPGTSQGLGAMGGAVNSTTGVTDFVHGGTYAAKLQSTEKVSVFAAASLYTGSFLGLEGMSANMEFGKGFNARPIALKGYYKYTPAVINKVDRVPNGVTIKAGETLDQCAIFIALAKKSFTFNNKNEDEYINYVDDPDIIAYGELLSGAATEGDGYVEFNIPLKYKSLTDKPTHIIVVCSSSKYGDYMTGGVGSILYVDDFSFIYEGEPAIW
ncbi:PCMD domain-containing protein [Parabacteroides sp.]|uniref:PCMD domain-containing protein n=1 Tax=Parabacteroides sp. TaxID=1869337 RepID=UPI00257FFF9A|nr:PCMD domain-containing protein [Parabacteroides sp.]